MKRSVRTTSRPRVAAAALATAAALLGAACGTGASKGGGATSNDGSTSTPTEAGSMSMGDDAGGGAVDGGPGAVTPPDGGLGDGAAEGGVVIGDPTGTTAVRRASFLDSIGVVHARRRRASTAPTPSATAMAYAGIRNLRDDGNPARCPTGLRCTRAPASACAC